MIMSLPTEMEALVLNEDGFTAAPPTGPYLDDLSPYLTLSRIAVPKPEAGQVLIRLRKASVNPSDIHFIKGEYGLPRVKGAAAGFEGCGDVVLTGPGAEKLDGQRVSFVGSKTGSGAWAEYVIAEAGSCAPLPDAIQDRDAAAFFVNPLTAVGMVTLAEEAGTGAIVLTAGASQLSKLIIGLAAGRGIKTIPLVRRASQVEMLRELGASHPLDTTAPDFAERFAQVCKAEKPRILLDAVADEVAARAFFAMPSRTRWIVYGKLNPAPVSLEQMGQFVFTGKRIEGFWLTEWLGQISADARKAAFATVFERFASGAWKTDIRDEIPLNEVHSKLAPELHKENTGKLLIVPSEK